MKKDLARDSARGRVDNQLTLLLQRSLEGFVVRGREALRLLEHLQHAGFGISGSGLRLTV
jgi:hypothetical protein